MLEKLKRKLKNYVSSEDAFVHDFDKQNRDKSSAQKKEIARHARISRLREHSRRPKKSNSSKLWSGF